MISKKIGFACSLGAALMLFPISDTGLKSQHVLRAPLSDRLTTYDMKVKLDPVGKMINGELLLTWKNPSNDTVSDLQFHTYLNAFKNNRSTFGSEGRVPNSDESEFGYIDILQAETGDGTDLTHKMVYLRPDEPQQFPLLRLPDEKPRQTDSSDGDESVLSLALDRPVFPGDSVVIRMQFRSKLPKLEARTGYAGDYYFVAQWFPKLAVYEPAGMRYAIRGGWNAHQFHRNSEFYANHSVYQVDITVPSGYEVGSGGLLVDEKHHPDSTKTLTFRAEDIVDFAWTASGEYVVVVDQWRHVSIRALFQPEHLYQKDRHLDALKFALEYLDTHVGPYPWPYVTLVDPPSKGRAAGGMEYTTLFTAGTFYGLPKGIHMPELVTIHEFTHAYFMGILATNEFEEPWMDEGMTTYWETRIMDWAYGPHGGFFDLPFLKMSDLNFARINYLMMPNPKVTDGFRSAWEFPHGSYGSVVYQKTATFLGTLERMIGTDVMDEIFKRYYTRWAFKHPATHDFIAIVNEVVQVHCGDQWGGSMDWFFDQFLKSDKMVDYAVTGIRTRKLSEKGGFFGHGENKKFIEPVDNEEVYRSTIAIERFEEAWVPIEILVTFDNGDELRENWDGKARTFDLVYSRPQKVVSVKIDPDHKILMDKNFLNNSYTVDPPKRFACKLGTKFLFFLQNLMQALSIIS